MRLFDTHCHFETDDATEIAAILRRAKAVGVEKLMAVGGSGQLNAAAIAAAGQRSEVRGQGERGEVNGGEFPEVIVALGYDRDQIGKVDSTALQLPTTTWRHRAIGEIGLDYHYSPETREAQLALFEAQLELARTRNLPVVIHTREADDDTVALLRRIPSRGIIHCYTGTVDYARHFLDLGFFVSISGIVTFKAAENVREVARYLPDDRFLIETDSPFLAPVPMRGNPNEPAFLRYTCDFLANLRGVAAEDFAELTYANAERILG